MSRVALLTAVAVALAACTRLLASSPDNAAALNDIRAGYSGREVTVEGHVTRLFGTQSGAHGTHERFVIVVGDGRRSETILVSDNLSNAGRVLLHEGDDVIVKGELALDSFGPVIHWTHRDPRMRHEPGFIETGGHRYE